MNSRVENRTNVKTDTEISLSENGEDKSSCEISSQ